MHSKLFVSLLVLLVHSNLICDGDLENYPLNLELNGTPYSFFPKNPACWDSLQSDKWFMMEYEQFSTTKSLVLIFTPCQNIELVPNQNYSVSFDAFCRFPKTNMNFEVILNGDVVFTFLAMEKDRSYALNFTFQATEIINKICFRETHDCMENYFCSQFNSGLIDNVSMTVAQQLTQTVPLEDVSVYFYVSCQQLQSLLRLQSNLTYSEELITHLKLSLQVRIQGQIQTKIQFEADDNANIIAFFKLQRNYDLSILQIHIPNYENANKHWVFHIRVENLTTYFSQLTQKQKNIIKNVNPVIKALVAVVKSTKQVMSGFLCSYFILGLLNFWNISLMYNFLIINNVPSFVRSIFDDLLNFIYTNNNLLIWLPQSIQSQTNFRLSIVENEIKEQMLSERQGHKWFQYYSFSSRILTNNLDNFLGLALLMVRIILLKLLIMLLPKKVSQSIQKQCNFSLIAFKEVISMAPFLLISAFTAMLSSSENFQSLFTKGGQTLIVLVVIICYIGILIPFRKTHKGLPPSNSLKRQNNEKYCEFDELLLGISTPILVIIGSPLLMLTVNGLLLVYTLANFVKRFKKIGMCLKFFGSLRIFVSLLFHSSYILLYALQGFAEHKSETITQCGLILLICVLFGGALEFLRSLIDLLILLIGFLRNICTDNKNRIASKGTDLNHSLQTNAKTQSLSHTYKKHNKNKAANKNKMSPKFAPEPTPFDSHFKQKTKEETVNNQTTKGMLGRGRKILTKRIKQVRQKIHMKLMKAADKHKSKEEEESVIEQISLNNRFRQSKQSEHSRTQRKSKKPVKRRIEID